MLSSTLEGTNPIWSFLSHPGGCPGQEAYVDGIGILVKLRWETAMQLFKLELCKTDLHSLGELPGHAEVQLEYLGASRIRRKLSLLGYNSGFRY